MFLVAEITYAFPKEQGWAITEKPVTYRLEQHPAGKARSRWPPKLPITSPRPLGDGRKPLRPQRWRCRRDEHCSQPREQRQMSVGEVRQPVDLVCSAWVWTNPNRRLRDRRRGPGARCRRTCAHRRPYRQRAGGHGLCVRRNKQRQAIMVSRLDAARHYAETTHCRRAELLAYFGETCTPPCGTCDNDHAPKAAPTHRPNVIGGGTPVRHRFWGGRATCSARTTVNSSSTAPPSVTSTSPRRL